MPKIDGTRKQIAAELKERLTKGPSFSAPLSSSQPPFSPEEASIQYQRWAESWILGPLCQLVPELKPLKPDQGFGASALKRGGPEDPDANHMNEGIGKNALKPLKRCSNCKKQKFDVKFRLDPYEEDVNGKKVHKNFCDACHKQAKEAI